ncbi:MAG: hypothetical protein LBT24_03345 [Tannerella sp.]|jgi:hypothetical protein|nr:hypothetical protein [Tannerella sp.]
MKNRKDVFKRFNESFVNMEGQFHVLEHRVPVEQQMEYFKFSDKVRRNISDMKEVDYEKYIEDLESDEPTKEDKKKFLSILAASKQVKAYRFLERFAKETDSELSNWAYMALMESRIILEFDLSGEKQIFISTGLGGRGDKLRFYSLIISSLQEPFADYQKKIINDELAFALQMKGCELERVNIGNKYVEVIALVPVTINIKNILEEVIVECNQYGGFLHEIYAITNVKEFDKKELEDIMKNYKERKN